MSNHSRVLSRERGSETQGNVLLGPTFPVGTQGLEPGNLVRGTDEQLVA